MMKEMFKGNGSGANSMLPMMMLMNQNGSNMFDGLFDFDDTSVADVVDITDENTAE